MRASYVAAAQLVGVVLVTVGLGLVALWAALVFLGVFLFATGLLFERYLQPQPTTTEGSRARSNEAS